MAPGDEPRDVQVFGDTVRLRHSQHFDDCATTGRWSGIYFDYLYRDLEPHLLHVLRELSVRADRELEGARRLAARNALYARQDRDTDKLVTFFLSNCSSDGPAGLGFGHLGRGRMGVTDEALFRQHLDRFAEAIWIEILEAPG